MTKDPHPLSGGLQRGLTPPRRLAPRLSHAGLAAFITVAVASCAGATASGSAASPTPPPDDGPRLVQPGAPGEPTRDVRPEDVDGRRAPGYTDGDVRFMQGMIPHHAQALEMVELIPERTDSEELRRLGLRIEISQRDEIRFMERWLRERGEARPAHSHMDARAGHDRVEMPAMPGMLTPEQMAELRAARGVEFERLFLEYMIRHHGGARVMVRDLFASPGAGQESRIFGFASDVDADQLMEIQRMEAMLEGR